MKCDLPRLSVLFLLDQQCKSYPTPPRFRYRLAVLSVSLIMAFAMVPKAIFGQTNPNSAPVENRIQAEMIESFVLDFDNGYFRPFDPTFMGKNAIDKVTITVLDSLGNALTVFNYRFSYNPSCQINNINVSSPLEASYQENWFVNWANKGEAGITLPNYIFDDDSTRFLIKYNLNNQITARIRQQYKVPGGWEGDKDYGDSYSNFDACGNATLISPNSTFSPYNLEYKYLSIGGKTTCLPTSITRYDTIDTRIQTTKTSKTYNSLFNLTSQKYETSSTGIYGSNFCRSSEYKYNSDDRIDTIWNVDCIKQSKKLEYVLVWNQDGSIREIKTFQPSISRVGNLKVNHLVATFSHNGCLATSNFAKDLAAVDIISPVSGCFSSAKQNIKIKISNPGTVTQSNFEVGYSINDGVEVLEKINHSIPPGQSIEYTFATPASITPSVQPAQVKVFTRLSADQNIANDGFVKNVRILPPDNGTVSGTKTLCSGQTLNLIASGGKNYKWSNGTTNPALSTVATVSANYYVTITGDYPSCVEVDTIPITVIPTPIIQASNPDLVFCEGKSISLTSNSSSNLQWNTGARTKSITVDQSGQYSVRQLGANECHSPYTYVNVKKLSAPIIRTQGNGTLCTGNSETIIANNGSSYVWSNGATTSSITV